MKKAIKEAERCVPSNSLDGAVFCTGFTLSAEETERVFNLSREKCIQEIQKHGYKTSELSEAPFSFIHSTKRAETFHESKKVFFKPEADRIDCIHELLHVFQWTKSTTSSLSPANRLAVSRELFQKLNQRVNEIERIEKAGNKTKAQSLANSLQSQIQLGVQWRELENWFDEKDVHYFIFQNCERLKCTDEDRDIAISNLYALKDRLPKVVRQKIIQEATHLLRLKQTAALKLARETWVSLSDDAKQQAKLLLGLDWKQLLKRVHDSGVDIVGIEAVGTPLDSILKTAALPSEIFGALPKPKATIKAELQASRLTEGKALGKFLCNTTPPTLAISQNASKGTVAHEFLHFLQNKQNGGYCLALTEQEKTAAAFKNGLLPRKEFESKILFGQALSWLAEYEVYSIMQSLSAHLLPVENINNAEMFREYSNRIEQK